MSDRWALLVPDGRDPDRIAALSPRAITSLVRTVAEGLALIVSGDVAGLVVLNFGDLAGVIEACDREGVRRARRPGPDDRDPDTRRPQRLGGPGPAG